MRIRVQGKLSYVILFLSCWKLGAAACFAQTTAIAAPSPNASSASTFHRIVPSTSPYARHLKTDQQEHATDFYQTRWGVDSLDVKLAESGQMVRFSYRITDPVRSAQLNNKALTPYLIDDTAHVKLEIPTMEKVGQLRQINAPEAGKSYWMVFSNKGRVVKPGDRVNILIGKFQANGLYVR